MEVPMPRPRCAPIRRALIVTCCSMIALLTLLATPASSLAQEAAPAAPAAASAATPATAVDASQVLVGAAADGTKWEINTGDHAWMLVSVALVLMMTGPGLALFYGGLVRRKNVLSTMMQS